MSLHFLRTTVCLLLTATHALAGAEADQNAIEKAASWEPVIVLSSNAQVFAGDKPGPKIPPGTIVYVSQHKDDWLLVPRYNNWLHEQHVRSLPTALAFLNEQLRKQPTGELHHYRAIVLSELGRSDEAIKDFDAAIAAGTNSSNVFLNRGLAWGRAGNRERAMSDFAIAIQRDDKNSHAFFNRGVLHARAGEPAAAIEDFDRAIKLEPTYAEAFNNRGVAHEELGHPKEAMADYSQAITLRPRFPSALTNRAYRHQQNGDFAKAIEDYGSALRMAPDSHPTLNDLAWLLATCPDDKVRSPKAALQYAERANQLTGNQDADYLDTLAAAAAANGDFSKAIASTEAALKLAAEDSREELRSRLKLYQEQKPYVAEASFSAKPAKEQPEAGDQPAAK
jgi:tetratricopeptide (TPR) repeat protein